MENVYSSFEPYFTVTNILAFFPKSHRNGKFTTNYSNVIKMLIGIIYLIFITEQAFQFLFKTFGTDFFASRIWTWIIIIAFLCIFFQIIFQLLKHEQVEQIFNALHRCDTKMRTMYIQVDHKRQKRINLMLSILAIFIGIAYNIFSRTLLILLNIKSDHTLSSLYCCYLSYKSFIHFQIIMISYAVRERFRALSSGLR
jgi:hypothetical protein